LTPATDLRALAGVRRLIAREGVRIVHTHMAKAGAVGRLAARGVHPRPRTVHTFHGHVLDGYFGPLARRGFLELERALARLTDVLVAVSPEVRDELLDLGIGKGSKFRVVPLGLDLGSCLAIEGPSGRLRSAIGVPAGTPLVGVVGRLVPIKDHETLFHALAEVPGAHLAVVGDGELREPLGARASALGIGGRVHFAGWWDDVASVLSDLDVVALSSRNEGTPVALIEALAARRPVVATDVGGVRHVVQDGETGLLCGAGRPGDLAALLRRALADRAGAERLAAEGRRRVAERFGSGRMVDDHRRLYEDLLH
jgi:glycosyltransferase involved in cell wall biosynthesis